MDDGDLPPATDPGASPLRGPAVTKKTKESSKRRFSDEQIKSLESMFKEEAKLEPGKKVRLAMDLGLQPRQVAIWFQNRRARWKSKQLEREYNALRADCDALSASVESLKKEKQSLLKQLQRLKEQLGEAGKEDKPKVLVKEGGEPLGMLECSDGEKFMSSLERLGPEESDLMNFTEPVNGGSITWPEEWDDLDSGSFSDQSCTTMEWWDVWC